MEDSFAAGQRLAESFEKKSLAHLFVLSNGLQVKAVV
jgi:hypothetical protein